MSAEPLSVVRCPKCGAAIPLFKEGDVVQCNACGEGLRIVRVYEGAKASSLISLFDGGFLVPFALGGLAAWIILKR